ncbi:hypothetical protein TVAG_109000 [Trichomonas vaginalis G3]|uniref:Uncharacterized protein n=1 Tax=Trichomonas vaginalis (strain ATCC PRA-98 / G3) TaxID=412133 RepID=A2F041_TRIV3|nr:hypothetical protein TVAGG3_0373990 [Trichomonas vaginalis G3]EAY01743.1 hypothetical protein TVAG_109000 [Trichomonas vaginalis G3]KAI5532808.1 hypothetical protein TVAGG3_0373990 [Trichomonas vaginalis G3]|eukprot:XP_001314301.1 hypothetical protein [Trichomonas vaginalis G3]
MDEELRSSSFAENNDDELVVIDQKKHDISERITFGSSFLDVQLLSLFDYFVFLLILVVMALIIFIPFINTKFSEHSTAVHTNKEVESLSIFYFINLEAKFDTYSIYMQVQRANVNETVQVPMKNNFSISFTQLQTMPNDIRYKTTNETLYFKYGRELSEQFFIQSGKNQQIDKLQITMESSISLGHIKSVSIAFLGVIGITKFMSILQLVLIACPIILILDDLISTACGKPQKQTPIQIIFLVCLIFATNPLSLFSVSFDNVTAIIIFSSIFLFALRYYSIYVVSAFCGNTPSFVRKAILLLSAGCLLCDSTINYQDHIRYIRYDTDFNPQMIISMVLELVYFCLIFGSLAYGEYKPNQKPFLVLISAMFSIQALFVFLSKMGSVFFNNILGFVLCFVLYHINMFVSLFLGNLTIIPADPLVVAARTDEHPSNVENTLINL